jgi:hypothetical protein
MDEITQMWDQHMATPFPEGREGDEVLGVDLVLTDTYTAGVITKFIGSRGRNVTHDDIRILKECYSDLTTVVTELSAHDAIYFARLRDIAGLILDRMGSRPGK